MMRMHQIIDESNISGFQLYCDMDGVLVDFIRGARDLMNDQSLKQTIDPTKKQELWKIHGAMSHQEATDWWGNLEWAPGGKELWNYIRRFNPGILSSPGKSLISAVEQGKMHWIKTHLTPIPKPIIFANNKYQHATNFNILIDDRTKNTIPWEEAGGPSILHIFGESESTIKELQERFGFPK